MSNRATGEFENKNRVARTERIYHHLTTYEGYISKKEAKISLFKKELQQLFNQSLVDITQDNIHLYYEFMSDEDLKENARILNQIFDKRYDLVENELNKRIKNSCLHMKTTDSFIVGESRLFVGLSAFCVKDTLKPIDEYIAEIKASSEYQNYKTQNEEIEMENAKNDDFNFLTNVLSGNNFTQYNHMSSKELDKNYLEQFEQNIEDAIKEENLKISSDEVLAYADENIEPDVDSELEIK